MNKSYAVLLLLVLSSFALYQLQPETKGQLKGYYSYLSKFGKSIPSGKELIYRAKIYADNMQLIELHNADITKKWKMGVNQFTDITNEEFVSLYMGELPSKTPQTVKV
jgi:hypothetical protein